MACRQLPLGSGARQVELVQKGIPPARHAPGDGSWTSSSRISQAWMCIILDHLAAEGRLEKFSSVYEEFCNYGTIDDMPA
jgi:hypothetical protein